MYFTIAALAAILMMSINLNTNVNSNMNAFATIISEMPNIDDIGQSAECVIVVVGCDGTGSVGSSGDTIIGSFNGNDDNNTNGNGGTPLPPFVNCEFCIPTALDTEEIASLKVALGLGADATLAEVCAALNALASVEALVLVLNEAGVGAGSIVILLDCFGIVITIEEVEAIIGL